MIPAAPAGNYGNNESYTMTFCSNSANCVQLNFTSFRTQGGNDILYLYDGPNTSSPLIGNSPVPQVRYRGFF